MRPVVHIERSHAEEMFYLFSLSRKAGEGMNTMSDNPWDEWERRAKEKQATAYRELGRKEEKLPTVKRPATDREKAQLKALSGCTFGVGTWDKRFVRQMTGVDEITEKQAYWILKLTFKYRRQLGLTQEAARAILIEAEAMLK